MTALFTKKDKMIRKVVFFLIAAYLVFGNTGYCYWEWTPKTGKWVNPKYAVKDSPGEQFEWAENFRKAGNLEKAISEHRKLIKHYENSEFAPKSCFVLGQIYQEQGNLEKAFEYYQKIIDNYPQSSLIFDVVKMQAEIADEIMGKKTLKIFEFLKGKEVRTEKMEKVVSNDPYSKEAPERYLKLALFYFDIKEYQKAKNIFKILIDEFPGTVWTEKAKFYLIKIHYNSIPEVNTNLDEYKKLEKEIETYLIEYPDAENKKEVVEIKNKLAEEQAKKLYKIASFYEKTGKKQSALIYYKKIVQNFYETNYGKIAEQKIGSGTSAN